MGRAPVCILRTALPRPNNLRCGQTSSPWCFKTKTHPRLPDPAYR